MVEGRKGYVEVGGERKSMESWFLGGLEGCGGGLMEDPWLLEGLTCVQEHQIWQPDLVHRNPQQF